MSRRRRFARSATTAPRTLRRGSGCRRAAAPSTFERNSKLGSRSCEVQRLRVVPRSTLSPGANMSGIFDIVQQQLSGGGIQQIAEQAGLDPATAQKAVTAAVPMILGGMAQHAKDP